jgi:nitrogenase subunit NifH
VNLKSRMISLSDRFTSREGFPGADCVGGSDEPESLSGCVGYGMIQVAQLLRRYATSRKVSDSRPDEANEFFKFI